MLKISEVERNSKVTVGDIKRITDLKARLLGVFRVDDTDQLGEGIFMAKIFGINDPRMVFLNIEIKQDVNDNSILLSDVRRKESD